MGLPNKTHRLFMVIYPGVSTVIVIVILMTKTFVVVAYLQHLVLYICVTLTVVR